MKAYKGFNKNMTCRGFQFEEGKTYELTKDETPKLCEFGFHACEAPIDCLAYYAPCDSVYHEVELDGVTNETSGDSKRVGSKITIGAKLDVAGIVKAQFDFTKEKCVNIQNGGNRSALTGGNGSALTGGYRSALTGGDMSALTGGNGSALTGGDMSALTGGYMSALTGGNGSVMRGGEESEFKGGMWAVFACEIKDGKGNIVAVKTAVVDGETLKPDTWYTLKNDEWKEVGE